MRGTQWFMLSLSLLIFLGSVNSMDPITAIGFYSAIVTIGDTLKKYTLDKLDEGGIEQALEDLKKTTKLTQDTVYRITNQISSLSTELTGSTLRIMNEAKLDMINVEIRFIKSKINHLVSTAPSPSSSPVVIRSYFNNFIESFQSENPDINMLELLGPSLPGSHSLLEVFIEKARHHEQTNVAKERTSTNKIVYELFTHIGYYIGQAHSLMHLCILIRKQYSPPNTANSDAIYFASRTQAQTRFTNIMKKALLAVDNFDDYVSYMDLKQQTADANKVPMKNVLQNYLEWEKWLSEDNNTCSGECEDYIKRGLNGGDGCYGELRDCKFKVPVHDVGHTTEPNDKTSRIYNGYGIHPEWFGPGSFDDTPYETDQYTRDQHRGDKWHEKGRKASTRDSLIFICHTCLCTCDNFNSEYTVRRFYAGKMEPQIPGYVITGVRFLEKNRVIFLQIQIGKLLPLAIIDESTVQWMDVPQDIGNNYIEFGYDFRKFSLDGILMPSQILTGVQFVLKDGSVRFQVYGQALTDFEKGIMGPSLSFSNRNVLTDVKSMEGRIIGLNDQSTVFTRTKDQIIKFGVSDEKTDAGQSFVPYFDGTNIEFDKRSPLSGVGFMHFTNDDSYAGYIRPYIMSFRYKNVIN